MNIERTKYRKTSECNSIKLTARIDYSLQISNKITKEIRIEYCKLYFNCFAVPLMLVEIVNANETDETGKEGQPIQ